MATFPATPAPSQSTSAAVKPRVVTMSFGDGYSQRMAEGINNTPSVYAVQWTRIVEADRVTFNNFLLARAGVEAFSWTPPNVGAPLKFICKDWSWVYGEYNLVDFKASFEQVYEA